MRFASAPACCVLVDETTWTLGIHSRAMAAVSWAAIAALDRARAAAMSSAADEAGTVVCGAGEWQASSPVSRTSSAGCTGRVEAFTPLEYGAVARAARVVSAAR